MGKKTKKSITSQPLSLLFLEDGEEQTPLQKYRVKRVFITGPMRGMEVLEIGTKFFEINKLIRDKKKGNSRILDVEPF